MATDTKFNMPVLTKSKPYERYKAELSLWKSITSVPASKIGPMIALSLPEDHESKIKDKVFDKMNMTSLSSDTGYEELVRFMDSTLLKDSLSDAFERYNEFEKFSRTSESVSEFIEEFDLKYNKLSRFNIKLPPEILAFKLLIHSNISTEEQMLVKSGIDYSVKDTMYEQTKASLKKFKGESGGASSSYPFSTEIKSESVNITYPRGRGGSKRSFNNRGGSYQNQRGSYYGNQIAGTDYGRFQMNTYKQNKPFNNLNSANRGGRRGNRNDSRPMNKIGPDGNVMRCVACDSIRHLLAECPHSYENQDKAFMSEQIENNDEEACLFTGQNPSHMVVLSTEAQNCAVLDSACSSTVCGKEWLNNYLNSLNSEEVKNVKRSPSEKVFRFGGGTRLSSEGSFILPATLAGKKVAITADVVDSDIPLLLSKDAMKKACMKLDLENDFAEIYGKKVHLNCTSAGHYCIPISDEKDVFTVDLAKADEKEREKVLLKLHCQFGHASSQKLIDLLKDAKIWKAEFKDTLEQIIRKCEICKRYSKINPRSVVSLPLAQSFNEVVSLDLKHWDNGFILHIIDVWSRYTMSVYIAKKLPQLVIDCLMKRWISIFGTMKGLMSDNGGEFTADEIKEVASILGVRLLTTAAQSPHQNGLNERVHSVVDSILSKLKINHPKLPLDVLLGWANMAKNSLHMVHGFSSHQLVFGTNPNLPNILTDEPPALEGKTMSEIFAKHLNCLHSSRQLFIQSESDERIRRALRHKIRASNEIFEKGTEVFYKKDEQSQWLGPAKVLAQDGKLIFVRHGNQLLRIAPNRLVKRFSQNNITEEKKDTSEDMSQNEEIEGNSQMDHRTEEERNEENAENIENSGNSENQQEPDQVEEESEQPVMRRSLRLLNAKNNWEVYAVVLPVSQQGTMKCRAAKEEELRKLKEFQVYEEEEDKGQNCISTRWVCTVKGEEIKARLVAKGFQEIEEVRADSPTIGKPLTRLTLSIAASKGWTIKSTDIKSAFLQSDEIDRVVYIKPPVEAASPGKVWRLKKGLYGLNDAARQFFLSLTKELNRLGCKQCTLDPTLHFLTGKDNILLGMIMTHVDDFIHCGGKMFEEIVMKPLVKRFLAGRCATSRFKYIGLNILQTENHEVYLDQADYAASIEEPNVQGNKNNIDLNPEEYTKFRALVGALNWLACGSRPDLAYDVLEHSSKFKKANQSDLFQCLKSVKRCKKDVVVNKFSGLKLDSNIRIILFSDASFANLPDQVSSSLGYIIFIADCEDRCAAISWKANKIKRICRSTLAAETMALVEGLEECLYLKSVIEELGFNFPITALVDSKSLYDAVYSTKLVDDKRLRIDIAALQQLCEKQMVYQIKWCSTEKMLANALTKRGAPTAQLIEVLRQGSLKPYLC